MTPKFTTKQDLSAMTSFFDAVSELETKEVSYGYYDDPHYSGLNTATLAAIHQQGWNNLPIRPFMTSAAVAFTKELNKIQMKMFGHLGSGGRDATPYLKEIGAAGSQKIKYVISNGLFPNNIVSDAWAEVKGFNEAMFHYGDLRDSTTFKVSKAKRSKGA